MKIESSQVTFTFQPMKGQIQVHLTLIEKLDPDAMLYNIQANAENGKILHLISFLC